jgi:preprotein translocase subunit SecA
MIGGIIKKVIGSRNDRVLKKLAPVVAKINQLEASCQALADDDFKTKTLELKQRVAEGETLDQILPEAFALVREASVRTLGLRPFDVQLIGGIILHQGKIAEMRTGEGKTLVATLPVYLNALTGHNVHIVTVNDYLARRDANWMEPIYNFLGMEVGVIVNGQNQEEKKAAYAKDITYGTNNEFGFDYLRDNMVFDLKDKVQRKLYYAIVDEVDSILIDEARTPLIISGPAEDSSELYQKIDATIPSLIKQKETNGPGDFAIDEKMKQAFLTEEGHQRVEKLFVEVGLVGPGESLYEAKNIKLMHHLNAALRAHHLFHRDVDYIIKNGEVVIVDEHTGRTMEGRRWSDGLHQAIEAKEKVAIRNENQTLASITFQNYFRLYQKLAGMTGTADTEAFEFQQIYGLEVIVIPTHKLMIRKDLPDQIFLTEKAKFDAVINDVKERISKGQPILLGTASIEISEKISGLLNKEKISHQVLNAKQHEREAKIIAQAGRPANVTIATNMAGRGTDIVLGGSLDSELAELENPAVEDIEKIKAEWQKRHQQVVASGGLHVIGSERHESRRIDNQLRGRSGRQGDPGSSRFYLSLEDKLMRIFASDKIATVMQKLGMKENEVIEHTIVTKAVENAQRKVEGHNFDIRKALLEFDDVANEQRKIIYQERDELMSATDIAETIKDILGDVFLHIVETFIPPRSLEEQWDIEGLEQQLQQDFNLKLPIKSWLNEEEALHEDSLKKRIIDAAQKFYQEREKEIEPQLMRQVEKSIMLQSLDSYWKEHLAAMDHLREGIHLRGYAQQNPKQEYKRESFKMFEKMLENIKYNVVSILFTIKIQTEDDVQAVEEERRKEAELKEINLIHEEVSTFAEEKSPDPDSNLEKPPISPIVRNSPKVGRNDPCFCGSGKKYKQCHGKLS